eukprot:7244719-Prymnesium_polylepis.1
MRPGIRAHTRACPCLGGCTAEKVLLLGSTEPLWHPRLVRDARTGAVLQRQHLLGHMGWAPYMCTEGQEAASMGLDPLRAKAEVLPSYDESMLTDLRTSSENILYHKGQADGLQGISCHCDQALHCRRRSRERCSGEALTRWRSDDPHGPILTHIPPEAFQVECIPQNEALRTEPHSEVRLVRGVHSYRGCPCPSDPLG